MTHLTRRNFLKHTALAGAALSLPARLRAAAPGANEDIRVAIVGFNSRGESHIADLLAIRGVRIVALCDVDTAVLDRGRDRLKKKNVEVETFTDLRKLLEKKDLDAISIATPNHWHALATIWACQAGKDVYVEKPVSHNIWEGRQMVEAAKKYNRIVQAGTQSRSGAGIIECVDWMKKGELGKIVLARGACYKPRPSIGKAAGPVQVPPTIDFDLWCGPAPKVAPVRTKFHYDWHWFWATGNGDVGNQGVHQMDIARWFLGEQLPPRVISVGGRLGYVDDGQTPNTQFIFHDYEKVPLIFEVRGLPEKSGSKEMDKFFGGKGVSARIECENGHVYVPDYRSAEAYDKAGQLIRKFPAKAGEQEGDAAAPHEQNHHANFIAAIRSRNAGDLRAPIIEGHYSAALCHLGNISHLLGKKLAPDAIREKIKGNKEAMETFGRMSAHLEANGVDLNVDKLTLGEFLKFDAKTEKFIGNPEADKLLTRDYRAPFVVPKIG